MRCSGKVWIPPALRGCSNQFEFFENAHEQFLCLPMRFAAHSPQFYTVDTSTPRWRIFCGRAALILAICSMLLELVFYYSWFHNGGSPHGLMPSPGIWKFVGRFAICTFAVSLVFTVLGKGKWRIFIPVWAVTYAFVVYMIAMLEMD